MTSDQRREQWRVAAARSRQRQAGTLPPLQQCERCGRACVSERLLPYCSICSRVLRGHGLRGMRRLAAEEIIRQLRAEARGSV